MSLNLQKYKIVCFSRRPVQPSSYTIITVVLSKYEILLIWGLESKRNFQATVLKSKNAFAFVNRWSKEFKHPFETKAFCTTLVLKILEYDSLREPQL